MSSDEPSERVATHSSNRSSTLFLDVTIDDWFFKDVAGIRSADETFRR